MQKKTCLSQDVKKSKKEEEIIEEVMVLGEIIEVTGLIVPNKNLNEPIPFDSIETPPEFQNTQQGLSLIEKKAFFQKEINAHIKQNFKVPQGYLDLTGRQRVNVKFEIDSLGFVKNIQVRAIHPIFKEEAKRVINLLPQFIPAKQRNKPTTVVYTLPIIFQVEE